MVFTACNQLVDIKEKQEVEDKLSTEELIEIALDDFIEFGSYGNNTMNPFIEQACPRNPTIDDIREVTDIKVWDGKYIELIVKGEYEDNFFDETRMLDEVNHKFYKYEDGILKDSERWDSSNEYSNSFMSREFDILDTEPDYSEENDGIYFLKNVNCDREKE